MISDMELSIETQIPSQAASQMKGELVVIGAAGKKGGDFLRALMQRPDINIAAVVINKSSSPLVDALEANGTIVIRNALIDALIKTVSFDIAVVCVPHADHFSVTESLLRAGKYVIKEKPLAMSVAESERYIDLIRINRTLPIFTTVQRNTMPSYIKAKQDLLLIGEIVHFKYDYWLNLTSITTGWRSKMATAFGGVILDMGYHSIDVILKFFGKIDHIHSNFISYKYLQTMEEDLEDYAEILIECQGSKSGGILRLNRYADEKRDTFVLEGENGTMSITPQGYQVFDSAGLLIKSVDCNVSKEEEILMMLNSAIPQRFDVQEMEEAFCRNIKNVKAIADIYACKQMRMDAIETVPTQRLASFGLFATQNNPVILARSLGGDTSDDTTKPSF